MMRQNVESTVTRLSVMANTPTSSTSWRSRWPAPTREDPFGIQLFDTTPGRATGRTDVESWPVLGEPVFVCAGV